MSGSPDPRRVPMPAGRWRRSRGWRLVRGVVTLGALCLVPASTAGAASWTTFGQNQQNSRFQAAESTITRANAGSLAEKWRHVAGGDISATPALDDLAAY